MQQQQVDEIIAATHVNFCVIPDLIVLFKNDQLKYSAVRALGNVVTRCKEALQIFRQKLFASDETTQYYLIMAIRYIEIDTTIFVPDLIPFLSSENDAIREITANALGDIKDSKATPNLLQIMCEDSSSNVRYYAMHALGDIKDTKTIKPLIHLINDSRLEISMYAIHILGKMGTNAKEAADHIFHFLQHKDEKMVSIAAAALGNMGDERARDVLQRISLHGSFSVTLSAKKALKNLSRKTEI